MLLKKLSCTHFKNYTSIALDFADQFNFIVGLNGAGKTNLLDAIHYLSLTKSAFNPIDAQNIQHGKETFVVQGNFIKAQETYEVQCIFQQPSKKIVKNNDKVYEKLHEHIGAFPIVLTIPYDIDLIRGSSALRRKFFDSILCQLDGGYLNDLIVYNRIVAQRNSLLRLYKEARTLDPDLLASYNRQLIPLGKGIFAARKEFLSRFYPIFKAYYQYLVAEAEQVQVTYVSTVGMPDFEAKFLDNVKQDLLLQCTTMGIHRDDFSFVLNGYPLKKMGSQGQQKSFIIALRLAQFVCIHDALQCKPLLLLDDIFDKLDEQRISRLVQLITTQNFGQVFMTAAGEGEAIVQQVQAEKALFRIEQGRLAN